METPYRLKNYEFTAADYAVHERHRQLLFSQRHMRAACLLGGIVWRLGRDILNDDDILGGPSDTVMTFGHGVFYRDIRNDEIWCNDAVSLDEVNNICGLHHVRTGMHSLLSSINIF
jgi:hypothetical protein